MDTDPRKDVSESADGRRARVTATVPAARSAELPVDDITDRIDAAQMWPRVVGALAALSAPDRELVLLVAWAGLSYDEAAQAMEIPLGTVRSTTYRFTGEDEVTMKGSSKSGTTAAQALLNIAIVNRLGQVP